MRVFMKILLIVGLSVSIYADNVDQKKFYDANRDNNEKLEKMSQELQLFIDSNASAALIREYQEATIELSEDEKAAQEEQREEALEEKSNANDAEPGLFTKMFASIGIGSTKKLPKTDEESTQAQDDTLVQEEPRKADEESGFFSNLLPSFGAESKKELPLKEESIETKDKE